LAPYKIVIVGVGKIARDQHIPVIAKDPRFRLAGVVSGSGARVDGVPTFRTLTEAIAALPGLDAVTIATPPHVRHRIAREALDAGKPVMLEKPPAATVAEMHDLAAYAAKRGLVIFATWHSQYNAAVDAAKARLAGQAIADLTIAWKEDVRRWHPGQEWIWDPGNFGVFDPGVNALSILTKIVPDSVFVKSARLDFPANRQTPIAASLVFSSAGLSAKARLSAEFDWRQEGEQTWTFDIVTAKGETLKLTHGGSKLFVDGALSVEAPMAEYEAIYDRFAALLAKGESAMDAAPFQLVADAFLVGARRVVAAFDW
jgi:D-galactose 1-dehydrogenase